MEYLEDRTAPAVFTVNTTNDTQDVNPGDGRALDAAGNTSLRAAIEEGNADAANGDNNITINVNLPANSVINLGIALPNLNNNFTINGASNLTVQRLANAGNFRVFLVRTGMDVWINNLTISNGITPGGNDNYGGGILNYGTLYLSQDLITNNQATTGGGAVSNAAGGTLYVLSCTLSGNQATAGGGAIANYAQAQVSGTSIYANTTSGIGGGILNYPSGQLTVDQGSQITNNTARWGGGIYNHARLTMSDAMLAGNTATQGGGLWSDATSSLTNVYISQNSATGANGKGGGFYVAAGNTTLTNCTISGNTCGLQGGGNGGCYVDGFGPTINGGAIYDQILPDPNP